MNRKKRKGDRLLFANLQKVACPLFLLFLTACGYQIAGRGGHIQSGVKTIAIPVFENKTMEPIVEEEFTSAVLKGFIKDSRLEVVDRSQADLVLDGIVTLYKESPLSFDQNQNALEYRMTITTHLRLLQQSTKNVLWERDITASSEYMVSSDVMSTRTAKLLALKEIAQNLAEEATDRVLWGW